jgi:hypothetical protein
MAHGATDARTGSGAVPAGSIRQPTHTIPAHCMCTWAVVRPGPGMECLSDLRYANSLCPVRHRPYLAAVPEVPRAS